MQDEQWFRCDRPCEPACRRTRVEEQLSGQGGIDERMQRIHETVLALAEPESTIHEVVKECDLNFADQNSPEEIADRLEQLLAQWESGSWGISEASKEGAARYRIDRLNSALDDLLCRSYGRVAP